MSGEWVVLQHVKDQQTGEVQSLIYDFVEETLELVPGALQEGRLTRGFAVPGWTNGKTIEVVQSLPLGSVGECYVEELHGEGNIFRFVKGQAARSTPTKAPVIWTN